MKIPKEIDINKVSDKPIKIDFKAIKNNLDNIGKKQHEINDTVGVLRSDLDIVNKAINEVEAKITDYLVARNNREEQIAKSIANADKGEQMREEQQANDYLEGEANDYLEGEI